MKTFKFMMAYLYFNIFYRIISIFVIEDTKNILFTYGFKNSYDEFENKLSKDYSVFFINNQDYSILFIKDMIKIARCKYIFLDDRCHLLTFMPIKNKKVCLYWHANGAIKNVSRLRTDYYTRESKFIQKLQNDFSKRLTYVTVSSDKMGQMFKKAYGLNDEQILNCGYPGASIYYKDNYNINSLKECDKANIDLSKVNILYMPTFRNEDILNNKQVDFVNKLTGELGNKYQLYYKFHQLSTASNVEISDKSISLENYNLKYLYQYFDLIITDYSSIVTEACRFKANFLFYLYDLKDYESYHGLYVPRDELPGKVTEDCNEAIAYAKGNYEQQVNDSNFCNSWNEYNSKKCVENIITKVIE